MGALPLSGRSLPVYFRLADRTRSVFRGPPVRTRLRRSLRKQTAKSLLSASSGKALQKQSKNLHKGNHRSPTTCEKWKNKITEGPNPGNSPGVGASLLRGKLPSLFIFYFRLANGYRAMDAQRLSRLRRAQSASLAYGVPYGSKPQLVCFVLHVGSPTKALTQSSRHNASLDARRLFAPTAFPKKAFSQSSLHNV